MAAPSSAPPPPTGGLSPRVREALARGLFGGALLALLEIALVVATAADLFLSLIQLGRYAVLALCALSALCGALAVAGASGYAALGWGVAPGGARHVRRLQLLLFACSVPACASALWLLTAGRRARDFPGRPWLVALAALAGAALLSLLIGRLVRARAPGAPRRAAWPALAFLALAAGAVVADAVVLRRLYPVFHLLLFVLAFGCALLGALFFAPPARLLRRPRTPWLVLAGAGVLAALSLYTLAAAPNARFAIRESAPLSGRLLDLARSAGARHPASAPAPSRAAAPRPLHGDSPGIDLRKRDVLLITVDALRADRLRAYGGTGLTPAMDALAAESAVFTRAYTPTPHTSYAIASLMTAKFMQPLFALADAGGDHATLPRLLRHHGYRTAAFYPPAIFFVDQERFGWLERDQLGFEYVKAMFASAGDRALQLQTYLAQAEPGHPLFVWVHLFEPHEPYDPKGVTPADDSPRARYDAEVAVADAGVGALIETFRRARPAGTVILTADHGEEFGEHGGHHHGTTLFDEQIRVPLLWSSPGAVRARRIAAPVEILDVTTSLLSALGIPREARMRGDDLGPWLAGAPEPSGLYAFSSIDGARMVTDGQLKLICGEAECQLYDLRADPAERRDVVDERQAEADVLRGELAAFAASLPRVEALALRGGSAIPEALSRARLGDRAAGPELVPLLSSPRAELRAAAARAIGDLSVASARQVVSTLRERDPAPEVRAECAIAALRLGDTAATEQVRALLSAKDDAGAVPRAELRRGAALALAALGDGSGEAVLLAAVFDHDLAEPLRLASIHALARAGGKAASEGLAPLLADVRLRPQIAATLGSIGDQVAVPALRAALQNERYPEARQAEADALYALGDRGPLFAQVRRYLGTESALPRGVGLLLEAGALAKPSGAGADLLHAASVRRGPWECGTLGCRPLPGATIALPARGAPTGPARINLRVEAEGASLRLTLAGHTHYLNPGATELAFSVPSARALSIAADADAGIWLRAVVVVKITEDIPPPAPEPVAGEAAPTPPL